MALLQSIPAVGTHVSGNLLSVMRSHNFGSAEQLAAIMATRYNPHVKVVYDRLLARGKSKMSAIGATMRKLVHLCFGVLKTRQPYQANNTKSLKESLIKSRTFHTDTVRSSG